MHEQKAGEREASENVSRTQESTTQAGAQRSFVAGSEQAETGMGERSQLDNASDSASWRANVKRTYDEYQEVSLDGQRRNRHLVDRLSNNSMDHDQQIRQISVQALQNAVETANMVGKNAIDNHKFLNTQGNRHSDIAIDRQWNVDEQGFIVEKILNNTTFQDGIKAAVVNAVNSALKPQG